MIRKFGFTLLVCGLFACQQDPYNVDVERSQLKITYQNLDSAFRYAHANQQRKLITQLLKSDFDLTQFCFPYALQVSTKTDSSFLSGLQRTYAHPFNKRVFRALDHRTKWRCKTYEQIALALKRLHVLAPKIDLPSSVYFT